LYAGWLTGALKAARKRISGYFDQFHAPVENGLPLLSGSFGGRIIVEKLTTKTGRP